jgi:hypothetical protein
MNSKNCILISQVWLTEPRAIFKEMLEVSVEYCRLLNPNSYIILSGMGDSPTKKTLDMCDNISWDENISEAAGNGFPKMITRGLQHAKDEGFERVFKFRGDAIILQENVNDVCNAVLQKEEKELLITQETTRDDYWIGDMVLHGDVDFLLKIFNPDTWTHNCSGNYALGQNFIQTTGYNFVTEWTSFLKGICSFRDIPFFKWLDIRENHEQLNLFKDNLDYLRENKKLDSSFDYPKYFWGEKQTSHKFDENWNAITNRPLMKSWMYEKFFYGEER